MVNGEVTIHRVILGGHLLQGMTEAKLIPPIDNFKQVLTETYVKHVLQSKNKVSSYLT